MPAKDDHIGQAEHNRHFWNSLDFATSSYIDWAVVGMFYEAVHWIEAYLATIGLHSRSHMQRASKISTVEVLRNDPNLVSDYGLLRTESENARYWNYKHTPDQISADLVPALTRLRNTLRTYLN